MRLDSSCGVKLAGVLGSVTALVYLSVGHLDLHPRQAFFSGGSGRAPSSTTKKSRVLQWAYDLRETAVGSQLSSKNCVSHLDRLTGLVLQSEPTKFELQDAEKHSEEVLRMLFGVRMSLFDQARPILSLGEPSEGCAISLRRVLRHLRGVEDYIGFLGHRARKRDLPRRDPAPTRPGPGGVAQDNTRVALPPVPLMEVPFPGKSALPAPSYVPQTTLLNPSLKAEPGVLSGDVLLSRGNAPTSALIARMAGEDTQFSHMALVYIDPKTREAWTIEAHIEVGSIVTPLKEWLADGKARTMIFRYPDAAVAHRAAEDMFKRVKPLYEAGKAIEYDFSFNMHDHSKLFCSEVVREGYSIATGGRVKVPLFPSRIAMKNRDLMDRLGIAEVSSFIPADIELDPRFSVIGEWRNFEKLPDVWQKDAVLTAIYTWLERDGYRFDSPLWFSAKGKLARGVRKAGMLKSHMPTYMTQDMIVLSFVIDSMTADLQKKLAVLDSKQKSHTGFPMTYYEILEELERIKNDQGPRAEGAFQYLHR